MYQGVTCTKYIHKNKSKVHWLQHFPKWGRESSRDSMIPVNPTAMGRQTSGASSSRSSDRPTNRSPFRCPWDRSVQYNTHSSWDGSTHREIGEVVGQVRNVLEDVPGVAGHQLGGNPVHRLRVAPRSLGLPRAASRRSTRWWWLSRGRGRPGVVGDRVNSGGRRQLRHERMLLRGRDPLRLDDDGDGRGRVTTRGGGRATGRERCAVWQLVMGPPGILDRWDRAERLVFSLSGRTLWCHVASCCLRGRHRLSLLFLLLPNTDGSAARNNKYKYAISMWINMFWM
jgi:hypothetical protein